MLINNGLQSTIAEKTNHNSNPTKNTELSKHVYTGEVQSCYLSGSVGNYPAGTITYVTNSTLTASTPLLIAKPLDPNIQRYPLPGELVYIVDLFGLLNLKTPINTFPYYVSTINIFGDVNINELSGAAKRAFSTIETTKDTFEAKPVIKSTAFEGDIIYSGRFGQAIRFSSTVRKSNTGLNNWSNSNDSKNGDPITIIRNGVQTAIDDILQDDCSIYLCSNQQLTYYTPDNDNGFDAIVGGWTSLNLK